MCHGISAPEIVNFDAIAYYTDMWAVIIHFEKKNFNFIQLFQLVIFLWHVCIETGWCNLLCAVIGP